MGDLVAFAELPPDLFSGPPPSNRLILCGLCCHVVPDIFGHPHVLLIEAKLRAFPDTPPLI